MQSMCCKVSIVHFRTTLFGEFAIFFVEFMDPFVDFMHFFVCFCRDRRYRASSKNFKILARRLFSSLCLRQILSSTPVRWLSIRLQEVFVMKNLFLLASCLEKNTPVTHMLCLALIVPFEHALFPEIQNPRIILDVSITFSEMANGEN